MRLNIQNSLGYFAFALPYSIKTKIGTMIPEVNNNL